MQFEYLVCQIQYSRVTFANGEWQGTVAISSGDSQAALDSCQQVWDYPDQAGRAGWQLITSANATITSEGQTSQVSYQLFLRRERMSDFLLSLVFEIETKNLTKNFGGLVAVNNLNLQITKGAIFGFLGPNGQRGNYESDVSSIAFA